MRYLTAMMLLVTFKDCDLGVNIQFWTDGNVFDIGRLQARTNYSQQSFVTSYLQMTVSPGRKCFGMNVSLKKPEVLHQSYPTTKSTTATVKAAVCS